MENNEQPVKRAAVMIVGLVFLLTVGATAQEAQPVISTVAQDGHLQPPTSGSMTTTAPTKTPNITETPSIDSQAPLTPRNLLKEYEKQMVLVTQTTCEELVQIAEAVHNGQISSEQAEYLSGQRLELGLIRLQYLDTMHQILDTRIQKDTRPGSEKQGLRPPGPSYSSKHRE
jgi:hypothetical protein